MQRSNVHSLALHKVSEVLGPTCAHQLLDTFLAGVNRLRLLSPADLEDFGTHLESHGEQVGRNLRRYAELLRAARSAGPALT